MIAGTRQKTIGGTAYRNDPLYAFGKAFTEAANDILTVENFDLFAEPSRAIRSTGAKEALTPSQYGRWVSSGARISQNMRLNQLKKLSEKRTNQVRGYISKFSNDYYVSYDVVTGKYSLNEKK